jgi:hypothetical protein
MVELRKDILDLSQEFHDEIAIICFGLSFLAWKYSATIRAIFKSRSLLYFAAVLALIVLAFYILTILLYVLYPNYVDHAQPTIATISWLGLHGRPVYPNWETDGAYGEIYGPILFLINGIFLLIKPTITMSKLPGVMALLGAVSLNWIVLNRPFYQKKQASFLFLAVFAILFTPFDVEGYWNRPEPFLVLTSVLTLIAALRLPTRPAAIAVGLLAGVAVGLKLHGFIYAFPAALFILAKTETVRDRIVVALIGITCAIIVAVLPFLSKEASIVDYFQYLIVFTRHPEFQIGLIKSNLKFSLFLIAPIIAAWFWLRPTIKPAEFWLLVGMGVSMAPAVVIASRDGAGPYYLLPFIPFCLYGTILILEAPITRRTAPQNSIVIGTIGLIVLIFAYGPGCIRDTWRMTRLYLNSSAEREKIAELQTFSELYPKSQMGISDDDHYESTYYRVLSVFQGGSVDVDFSVWMDLAAGGISEDYIIRFIKECSVTSWILPVGEPFTAQNDFLGGPMLSDEFRRVFAANYRLVDIGGAYQVWVCLSDGNQADRGYPQLAK